MIWVSIMFRRIKAKPTTQQHVCEKWEYYLIKGNEYYFRGQYQASAYCYSVSAEYLEVIVSNKTLAECCEACAEDRCFQHYFIACQNTSHAYAMAGELEKAEAYLSRAHFKFLALVSDSVRGTDSWQEKIRSISEKSLDALVQFLERHNRVSAADSVMMESRRLLGDL